MGAGGLRFRSGDLRTDGEAHRGGPRLPDVHLWRSVSDGGAGVAGRAAVCCCSSRRWRCSSCRSCSSTRPRPHCWSSSSTAMPGCGRRRRYLRRCSLRLMPPIMAKLLAETGGGNPEPFLYVLLLWVLRARPLAFGLVFAFGFAHREFTVYGVTALVAVAVLADRRVNDERLQSRGACRHRLLRRLASDPRRLPVFECHLVPVARLLFPSQARTTSAALLAVSALRLNTVLPSMAWLFGNFFGVVFGATNHRFVDFGLRSTLSAGVPGVAGFWPVLGLILAAALVRVVWISIRDRKPMWTGPGCGGSVSAARRSAIRRGLCLGAVRPAGARYPALRAA